MMFSATQHTIPVEKKHGAKNTETKICISGGKSVSCFLFLFFRGFSACYDAITGNRVCLGYTRYQHGCEAIDCDRL